MGGGGGGSGTAMTYLVTHGVGAVAIDQVPDLKGALDLARQLLSDSELDVAIQDGSGKRIYSADLAACCLGEKTLTADLRAELNHH
jgi:hypothetical protein